MTERRNVWSTRRAWLYIVSFVATFVVLVSALKRLVPWPEEYGLRAKFEYYRDHKDEFDAIYVGSSRFFRGLQPTVIDEEMTSQGMPMRSFNLGVGGMTTFEQDFLLRQAVGLHSAKLRWIFLEGGPWDPADYFLGNTFSSRSIFWHDDAGTVQALRSAILTREPPLAKWSLMWTHLQLWAMKTNNMGQGKRVVESLLGIRSDLSRRTLTDEDLVRGRGYQSLEDLAVGDLETTHKKLLEEKPSFDRRIATIPPANAAPLDVETYNFAALRSQYETAQKVGATLIFVLPPNHEGNPDRLRLHERGDIPILFDWSDQAQFPEYFDLDNRFDQMHLNRAGSLSLSQRFAALFAEQWKKAH